MQDCAYLIGACPLPPNTPYDYPRVIHRKDSGKVCCSHHRTIAPMPTLDEYAPLAPFDLTELVKAANSILRERPHLQVQERTVRFYMAKGLLPPHLGAPKNARYSMDHLRILVSIRNWSEEGDSLEAIRSKLYGTEPGSEPLTLASPRTRKRNRDTESLEGLDEDVVRTVTKFNLGYGATLEISAHRSLNTELERVISRLQQIQQKIDNIT